jgi:hypothetical protein
MAGGNRGRDLARRLLAREADDARAPEDIAGAAVAVCRKLYLEVGQFVGADGYKVLLARSLHLARTEFSFLEAVRIGDSDDDWLPGLTSIIPKRNATEVTEGMAAVLGGFVDLLSTFIGDDLTLRMIHRRWPEMARPGDGDEGKRDG